MGPDRLTCLYYCPPPPSCPSSTLTQTLATWGVSTRSSAPSAWGGLCSLLGLSFHLLCCHNTTLSPKFSGSYAGLPPARGIRDLVLGIRRVHPWLPLTVVTLLGLDLEQAAEAWVQIPASGGCVGSRATSEAGEAEWTEDGPGSEVGKLPPAMVPYCVKWAQKQESTGRIKIYENRSSCYVGVLSPQQHLVPGRPPSGPTTPRASLSLGSGPGKAAVGPLSPW